MIWYINPVDRVTKIISCKEYEENFLKEIGFQNRDNCIELNLALHKQYLDDCLRGIRITKKESSNKKLLNLCIYHLFERDGVFLNSEYLLYREKQNKQ